MNDLRDGLLLLEMDENSLQKYILIERYEESNRFCALSEAYQLLARISFKLAQKKPEYIDSDVLDLIETLIENKTKYSQKVRHLAIKIRNDFLKMI